MKKTLIALVLGLILILSLSGQEVIAALQVWPHLIEMDARNRTASLTLTNLGHTEERFRISLGFIVLDEEGRTAEIEPGPEHLSAIPLIRFMPRSVTLAPGEHQVVRLRLRMPAGLATGEYRAHIFFEQVPPLPPPLDAVPTDEITIQLTALQRVGIPIMVSRGELQKKGELSYFQLRKVKDLEDRLFLSFLVTSTGSRSLRGNIVVEMIPPGGGRATPLFLVRNFVVYTPGERRVIIPLEKEALAGKAPGSTLRVIYSERGGRIIAQAEIEIE